MAFDVNGALNAGYSKTEIADHLAQQRKFDTLGARQAGYTDDEIIQHLSSVAVGAKPASFLEYLKTVPLEQSTMAIFEGAPARAAELAGSGLEAVAEVGKRAAKGISNVMAPENETPQQKKIREEAFKFELADPLFDWAKSLKGYSKNIGYEPGTKLSDLAENPINAIPFITERVITSVPDMAAAAVALPAYIGARTKEILDERMKNDKKTLDDATVADVTAAASAAIIEGTLEKFATGRLTKGTAGAPAPGALPRAGRVGREAAVQAGTEAIEETAAYLGEAAGTLTGVEREQLLERAIEAAIVGGGLGAGIQGARETTIPGKKPAEPTEPTVEPTPKPKVPETPLPERAEAEPPVQPTEPGMAPEDLALAAFQKRTEEAVPEAAKPIEPAVPAERVTPLAEIVSEEAPEIPEVTALPKDMTPAPRESDQTKAQMEGLEKAAERIEKAELASKTNSLYNFFRANKLDVKEVNDITPDKTYNLIRKKGGADVSDFVGTGQLNPWLPPQMQVYGNEDAVTLGDKESEATEYIKEKLRNRNFLTFDTEMELEQINLSFQELEGILNDELSYEKLLDEANSIAAEIAAEEGLSPAETAPEILTTGDIGERAAPEGEPEVGFRQVVPQKTSEQFKQRFAGSKIVDEKNNPVLMYHGTTKPFDDTLQTKKGVLFLTPDPLFASKFAMDDMSWRPEKQISAPPGARVIRVYAKASNPFDFENPKHINQVAKLLDPRDRKRFKDGASQGRWQDIEDFIDSIQEAGFDSSYLMELGRKNLAVFSNDQVIPAAERFETAPEFELEAETAEETVARQERQAEEAQKRELKKIADNERDLFKLEQQSSPASPPVQGRLFDVTTATPIPIITEAEATPSFTREFDRLSKMLDKGTINPEEFAARVQMARRSILAAKEAKPVPERVRGADFIMERLLRAKRQGIITEEAVELTDWFIKQNPELVKDLGISIRMSDTKGGEAGMYFPTSRIARLVGGSAKSDTAIHEILHHLERMMPAKVQNDIQKSWLKNFAAEQKKAVDTKDTNAIKYFELLGQHHSTGKAAPFEEALNLIKNGSVPYQLYQYANPSEFWAVNASRIMQGKFDVRGDRLGALKTWLSKLAQKIKEVFGFKSDASIIRALDSLAKSDGKFVSTEMLASGEIFPNVRTNVFGGKPPQPGWGRPDDSKTDDIIFFLQDKQVDTKRVIEGIEKAAGKLKDRWNAYMQEELYHGRTAKKTNDFIQNELNPLLKDMKARGFTVADVEEFLHNRHAQERNEQVAKVNPNMPDGGSGILTADAKAYLASLSPAKRKSLEAIAKRVDDITQSTRKILVDTGLELPSTIQAWEKAYKNYVPLNRAEDDYELSGIGKGVGQGFSVRGPSSRRATGSSREVVDILANIAMQRERAIVRSEKSRVSQAIYGLAIQHPNPDFWLAIDPTAVQDPAKTARDLQSMGINPADAANIMAEPTQTYVDPNTGLVTKRINPALRGAENVLAVRVNGEDKFVFFNTKDPRALRMATALKNLDADQLGTAMSMVARVTRYFAAVNTQYNPIFGVINFLRDYQGAALNLTNTPIAGETKKVMKDTWPALMGIYADLRKTRKGQGPATSKWANLWEEFQKEGGQTGFRDQFSRSQERADALERELNRLSEGKPMQSARAIFDWLSDYNESMENAVRLAAYKAGLDKGLTKEQAASVAKNLTVNFNRKGQIARQTNALYAFFNASVQGTARMYQTLRGPAGKNIMYGGLLLGSAQALLLAAAGFDEDEPPDFVKERNIVIPTGGGKYVTIPMPLGFNIIPNTSRVMTEWMLSGGKDTSKRIAQILGATLEMFNPIGNAGWSLQTFAPTVLDPVAALGENKDWTGKPIAKKDISSLDPTPGYTRAKDTASWFSKNLAEFLNYATGGTKYRPGFVSPTPDQIDYLIGQATGGVGREIMKAEQTVTSAVTGEELPTYKIPLVGRFIGETKGQAAQRDRFYDNIKLLNEHENEIKGRRKNRESVEEYIRENPESRLFGAANTVERQIQVLRRRREELLKKDAPKSEVQAVEKRITEIMTAFNERVRKVKEGK